MFFKDVDLRLRDKGQKAEGIGIRDEHVGNLPPRGLVKTLLRSYSFNFLGSRLWLLEGSFGILEESPQALS